MAYTVRQDGAIATPSAKEIEMTSTATVRKTVKPGELVRGDILVDDNGLEVIHSGFESGLWVVRLRDRDGVEVDPMVLYADESHLRIEREVEIDASESAPEAFGPSFAELDAQEVVGELDTDPAYPDRMAAEREAEMRQLRIEHDEQAAEIGRLREQLARTQIERDEVTRRLDAADDALRTLLGTVSRDSAHRPDVSARLASQLSAVLDVLAGN
jgi:hypothetical protein